MVRSGPQRIRCPFESINFDGIDICEHGELSATSGETCELKEEEKRKRKRKKRKKNAMTHSEFAIYIGEAGKKKK
jgi:hypothetical protein